MKRKGDTESVVENVEQTESIDTSIGNKSKRKVKKINELEGEAQEIFKHAKMLVGNMEQTGEHPNSDSADKSIGKKLKKKVEKINEMKETQAILQVKSTNQKKKKKKKSKKAKNNQIANKKDDDKDKCIEYLKRWHQDKKNWKFEKLRQIWLLKNMFDSAKVPDFIFPIFVDYISGSRGHARNIVEEKTMNIIKLMEKSTELSEKGLSEEEIAAELAEKVTEIAYERARLIIQSLDDV